MPKKSQRQHSRQRQYQHECRCRCQRSPTPSSALTQATRPQRTASPRCRTKKRRPHSRQRHYQHECRCQRRRSPTLFPALTQAVRRHHTAQFHRPAPPHGTVPAAGQKRDGRTRCGVRPSRNGVTSPIDYSYCVPPTASSTTSSVELSVSYDSSSPAGTRCSR